MICEHCKENQITIFNVGKRKLCGTCYNQELCIGLGSKKATKDYAERAK